MVILQEQRNNTVVINVSFIIYHTLLKGIYEGYAASSQEPHEHESALTSLAMVPHHILVWSDALTTNALVLESTWWGGTDVKGTYFMGKSWLILKSCQNYISYISFQEHECKTYHYITVTWTDFIVCLCSCPDQPTNFRSLLLSSEYRCHSTCSG